MNESSGEHIAHPEQEHLHGTGMHTHPSGLTKFVRNVNAIWIVVYCAIITIAFDLQVFEKEVPCPLCYLQRVGMLLVCAAAAMNLLCGIRPLHYSLAIFGALCGSSVAVRQILLHICYDFPKFGVPFWGLSLYTWSFLTFLCSIFVAAVLIGLYHKDQQMRYRLNWFQRCALGWFIIVILGNIASVLIDCGLGPCPDV